MSVFAKVSRWLAANDDATVKNIYQFWCVVVLLNAAVGLFFSFIQYYSHLPAVFGIIAGVLTCVVLYAQLDIFLLKSGYVVLSRQVRVSACLRMFVQLMPFVDIAIGALALGGAKAVLEVLQLVLGEMVAVDNPFDIHKNSQQAGFLFIYVTTLLHAFIASLIVVCLVFLGRFIVFIRR